MKSKKKNDKAVQTYSVGDVDYIIEVKRKKISLTNFPF